MQFSAKIFSGIQEENRRQTCTVCQAVQRNILHNSPLKIVFVLFVFAYAHVPYRVFASNQKHTEPIAR